MSVVESKVKSPIELIVIGVAAIVNPVVPSCVKVASLPAPKLRTALSESNFKSFPITTSRATDKPPSVCKEPSVVEVAFVVSSVLIIPVEVIAPDATVPASVTFAPENVAAVVVPDLIIRLPLVLVAEPKVVPLSLKNISPPEASKTIFVPASRVIPPASEINSIDAAPFPWSECILIVSLVPPFALRYKALAAFSVEVILTEEPVAIISMSSPEDAPDAKISIPPAVASTLIASAPVPAEFNIKLASTPPA